MATAKKPTAKKSVTKTTTKKAPVKEKTSTKEKDRKKVQVKENKNLFELETPVDLSKDLNDAPMFDTFIFRELFMALRKNLDDLAAKRGKSDKDYTAYDEAVYNLIANTATDVGAQDFIGYCYKKGFYDFCILNYEKFMKWTILAAANGNPFSISKLQIFFANALDIILTLENQSLLMDFLELTSENYYMLLQKMMCQEMVKILDITPEKLIKLPEVYQEQNDELTKLFNNAKMDAAEKVRETLKKGIEELEQKVSEEYKKIREQEEKEKTNNVQEEVIEENVAETTTDNQPIEKPVEELIKKPTKKAPSKQKFRW